ncbi:hypothetical protein [Robertkochia flava]|uniref:hypothetical protein n=1 Tax=Robertkochia flava TaxID=3447986 RepID=UPI001CCC7310|nr:hypothetical protein [Robertkochia marina]
MASRIQHLLDKTSALRADRDRTAQYIGSNAERYAALLQCALAKDPEISKKACWVLETVILNTPELLRTDREELFRVFQETTDASAIRPLAKIIAFWSESFLSKGTESTPTITKDEADILVSLCFNWLLADHPVAIKVFSMEALLHLGREQTWVHRELKDQLVRMYPVSSPAFRARARKILGILG